MEQSRTTSNPQDAQFALTIQGVRAFGHVLPSECRLLSPSIYLFQRFRRPSILSLKSHIQHTAPNQGLSRTNSFGVRLRGACCSLADRTIPESGWFTDSIAEATPPSFSRGWSQRLGSRRNNRGLRGGEIRLEPNIPPIRTVLSRLVKTNPRDIFLGRRVQVMGPRSVVLQPTS